MRRKKAVLAAALLMTGAMCKGNVLADAPENTEIPSLYFTYEGKYDGVVIPVDGATIEVTKVADATDTEDNGLQFTLAEGFEDYSELDLSGFVVTSGNDYVDAGGSRQEVAFDNLSAAENTALAGEFAALDLDADYTVTTDADGKAKIKSLEPGIYLVVQTASEGTAASFSSFSSYLVSIPETDENGEYVYQVESSPKTMSTASSVTDTPSELIAGIGDDKQTLGIAMMAVSVMVAVLAIALAASTNNELKEECYHERR